ncbi:peptide chain release factor H [Thiorhodococcus mannitoliphagus]|uniref:Peptide chain release factor H n=1 Tax=Thiorhodococcus mannitoliphagus TaxID=329406 RepID=A0A6P1E7X6_9GAMM|nr:peptide chain release factor H [Thiorhodococcus mannitoliphagus]NEX23595.1 peptide chain release factor H [Thiorhodococcus mannitoliphagus]
MQISAGRCPAECVWVVGRLAPQLAEALAGRGLKVEEIDRTSGSHVGDARSVLFRINGPEAPTQVADWLGTIQWIGTSPYRPRHKRKNWFVSVAVFAEPVADPWNERNLRIETLRASGPGGQHVNRSESAVCITHTPTGLTTLAQEERSQHLNRRLALARLASLLAARADDQAHAAEDERWRQHTQLERGNAVRVYRGADWRRER